MWVARIAYIAFCVGAAALIIQLGKSASFLEIFLLYAVGAICYEVACHKLKKKVVAWPSDRENAESVIDLMSPQFIEDIRSAEFGWISDSHIDQLRSISEPGLKRGRFHDSDLKNSYSYLREQVRLFLAVVDSEMFADDNGLHRQVIPLEWKSEEPGSYLHGRYRDAQRSLGRTSRSIEEAIHHFADCFQGASLRL